MDPTNLARALVAHPKFHYEQGMAVRVLRDGRWLHGLVDDASGEGGVWVAMGGHGVWINLVTNADGIRLESVDDPATVGHLLAMLREACRARHLVLTIEDDPRCEFPEVRVTGPATDLSPGPTAAFVHMPLGTALARALLAVF